METAEETARALLAFLPLVNRMMAAELRQDAGEDATMPQFRVLAYLAENSLTLSEIARLRHVTLQAAGLLVQAMVERGWVSRVPDPEDRRQAHLHLTELGRQQYQHTFSQMLRQLIPLIEQLSAEEMSAVRVALPALQRVFAREVISEDGSNHA